MNPVLAGLKSEPGRLTYRGIRYLLIRPETLMGLQRAARDVEAVAQGGFEGGRRTAAKLAETLHAREIVEAMSAMGGDLGWGRFSVARFGDDGFEVVVEGSAFAEAHGASEGPVCHFVRGVLRGIGTVVYGAAAAVERSCAAAGGSDCRFSVARS